MTHDHTAPHTPESIRRALWQLDSEPNGSARNTRAEELVALAETTGDRPLLLEALLALITSYQFSSESGKTLVPFARLLRMWDENPGDFSGPALHRLHWQFKWITYGLTGNPAIPLDSVRRWLPDMERHYRLAGHSLRPVRAAEFYLAQHIGDDARAARLLDEWTAADRDGMSDCLACELNEQGDWYADRGDDERALATWAPVLHGEESCAEQPHLILALSLLPLLRLGRFDEARRNHLRGYRLARGNGSLVPALARHIEFCALTGNEARGLEILAEHAAYLDMADEPLSRLHLLSAAVLLLRRLTELGHGDQPVPMPGGVTVTTEALLVRTRDAAHELAGRFDQRNGTDRVGRWVAARMAGTPFTDRLALGVRGARLAAKSPVRTPSAPETAGEPVTAAKTGPEDVASLVAEAGRRTQAQHPAARDGWRAVAEAAERTGTALDARARAEVAYHAALDAFDDPDTAIRLFHQAAEQFESAGDPGEGVASRARAAFVTAVSGRTDAGRTELDALCGELRTLHADGRATARQLTGALLAAARVRLGTLGEAPDPEAAAEALTGELRGVLALAEQHRAEDRRMLSRIADTTCLLGSLLAGRGDEPQAAELYTRAVRLYHEAAVPWLAAEAEARLADLCLALGRPHEAAKAARAALEDGAELFEPMGLARLHLLLAEALAATEQDDNDVAEHALEATHWADEADRSEGIGAWARLVLGGALLRLRRFDEAASVLESALPDLQEHHQEAQVVQARWWLGECHGALGEPRQAGEHFLVAADIAKGWQGQRDHAVLAHLAGDALNRAGMHEQAAAAYARAEELWRGLGHPDSAARAVRARAWLALRDPGSGLPVALDVMATAEQILTEALAEPADDALRATLRSELAGTHRQTGELLVRDCGSEPGDEDDDGTARRTYEAALGHLEKAIEVFASLGPAGRHDHSATQLMAAWLEADLGHASAAGARARTVLDAYGDTDGEPDADGGADRNTDVDGDVDGDGGADRNSDRDRDRDTAIAQRHRAEARALLDQLA
ncbi:tetratricopeptide repeat protein [Streptomyces sp. NPDC056411]|uniref:tetratricopeptide repeat protein n=1 Tax=Streptomyces sp. NPDC056411 TaxID=3345813 RepID=UPI0035DCDF82